VSWCGICGTDLEEWQDGPLSAAVSGGLALLRDEPAKHVKILVQPEEPA
jgi:hypothetical protein